MWLVATTWCWQHSGLTPFANALPSWFKLSDAEINQLLRIQSAGDKKKNCSMRYEAWCCNPKPCIGAWQLVTLDPSGEGHDSEYH